MKKIHLVVAALMGLALPATAQTADPQVPRPLWEIGAGTLGRVSSAYPGASDASFTGSVIPYLRFRGKLLELGGEDAVRVTPIRTERFELGISLDSSQRVANRVTSLGAALPDLDRLVEIGPELGFILSEDGRALGIPVKGRLEAILQTRAVVSIADWDMDYEGAVVRPALRYRVYGTIQPGSRVQASIGPIFATEGVQDNYYEIAASGSDKGYDAKGGYMGTELRGAMRVPLGSRWQVIGGAGVSYLGGAVNVDSPAMDNRWDATAFLGFTYSLIQSDRTTFRDR